MTVNDKKGLENGDVGIDKGIKDSILLSSAKNVGKGLYSMIGKGNNGDLIPGVIENFLAKNSNIDTETRKRLLLFAEESIYWDSYAKNVSIKYRRTYYESPTYQSMVRAIDQFINPKRDEVWGDLGCGALQMSKLILKKTKDIGKIYAMDVFLAAARGELLNIERPQAVELVYGSLTDSLPFPNNFFNGIIVNCAFTFIIEHEGETGETGLKKLFQEIYRVLKPGGVLVWSSPCKDANNILGVIPSVGYALNPYLWFKLKTFLPIGIVMILKHTKTLLKKGKSGIYPILSRARYEEISSSVGFVNSEWEYTFGHQGEANRVYKS